MKQQKRNTIFAGVSFLETDQRISLGVSCFEKRNTQVPSPVSSASSAGRGFAFRIHSSLGGVACWYIKPLKLPKQHEKVGIRKIPTWKSRDWRNRKEPYGVVGGNVDICLRSGVKLGGNLERASRISLFRFKNGNRNISSALRVRFTRNETLFKS